MVNKAEFGMTVLRVTQGPNGSISHKGREAIDFGGANYSGSGIKDEWHVRGCSWEVMHVQTGGDHFVYFQTLEHILWADGTKNHATLALCHMDDISGYNVGRIIPPGKLLYKEGTYSGGRVGAVDAHIHCQVGKGRYAGTHLSKTYNYRLPNEAKIQNLFFVPDDVTISGTGGLKWVRSSAATNNQEDNDMKIKIFAPQKKTPSSQLIKEGWILSGDGRFYNPNGEARMVKQYDTDLSKTYESMRGELQPGEILMATVD